MKKIVVLSLLLLLLLFNFAWANSPSYFALPESGYLSNVVIDIIEHDGGIWFASGEGLNYSLDNGETWYYYDDSNGLVSPSISALISVPTATGNRLWVATNHVEEFGESNFNYSDGLSYSDDNGATWTQVNFGEDGLNVPYIFGPQLTIFDITGFYDPTKPEFDNWLFFSAFAGGFLASKDGGENWRRIYPSRVDSIQYNIPGSEPSFQNRNFACAVDTSHGDSMYVWTGTANGFYSYVFVEPDEKPYSKWINDIFICDSCGGGDSSFVFYAGNQSLTRGTNINRGFISRFEEHGLGGDSITAVFENNGYLYVGSYNQTALTGRIDISTDNGATFQTSLSSIGDNQITDFAVMNNQVYAAGGTANMYATVDDGLNWVNIKPDINNLSADNHRNNVYSFYPYGDTLLVGTDSGLVHLFMDPTGFPDSIRFQTADDFSSSEAMRVVNIKVQNYQGSDVVWTVNHPNGVGQAPMITRSSDDGLTFTPFQIDATSYDINFLGDTTFVVGTEGVRFTADSLNEPGFFPEWNYSVDEYINDIIIDSLGNDTVTVMEVKGDTIIFGCSNGFAVSIDRGETYDITRINTDSLKADVVLNYTSNILGINSDWCTAIEVQEDPDKPFAWVWASTRPSTGGSKGISVGVPTEIFLVDTLTGDTIDSFNRHIWHYVHNEFAWNFDFAGDTVFAATETGLVYGHRDMLLAEATYGVWDTLTFADDEGNPLLAPGTPVYGVKVTDEFIWVGTDDRTIKVNRSELSDQSSLFVVDDETPADEVYAFPVPFSNVNGSIMDFHFVLENPTDVTIEIYDFAMNLVSRVIDSEPLPAGIYPGEGANRITWDGFNGKGDQVAVGVYYFKLETSDGDIHWGKLAVIP